MKVVIPPTIKISSSKRVKPSEKQPEIVKQEGKNELFVDLAATKVKHRLKLISSGQKHGLSNSYHPS